MLGVLDGARGQAAPAALLHRPLQRLVGGPRVAIRVQRQARPEAARGAEPVHCGFTCTALQVEQRQVSGGR